MTDAPKRIWAGRWPHGGRAWRDTPAVHIETAYIRADLVAALEAENQRLREALDPDNLAQIIRAVDGGNRLGAGALAEKISAALRSTTEASSHDD